MLIAKGELQGCNGHVATGSFTIESENGVLWFRTSEDFYFEGAPAPGFAISSGGVDPAKEAKTSDFLRLPGTGDPFHAQRPVRGVFEAPLPGSVDIESAVAVFLWCYDFPGVLGVGKVNRADRLVA
ncbi:MAG: hypothetical protein AB3N11_06735 [Arenibacterium sp.]